MRIIILEGVATSGKSLLAREIAKAMRSKNVRIFEESKTHEPIMNNIVEALVDFFKDLIDEAIKGNADVVVFERLYLTQAFRAMVGLDKYSEIEDLLMPYSPMTIFLKVDEDAILSRVQKAMVHRDPEWGEYVSLKGQTPTDIAQYYINQQRQLLRLIRQSRIRYQVINTTNHGYAEIAEMLARKII